MSKPIDSLERKIRSRPGAAERIDARTDAMRSVLRLTELREQLGKTQVELADLMQSTQANISRVERTDNPHLATLADFVGALGGTLEINAVFPDQTIPLGHVEQRGKASA